MNNKGDIKKFSTQEEAKSFGYDLPLTEQDLLVLNSMSQENRQDWYTAQKKRIVYEKENKNKVAKSRFKTRNRKSR